jgi:signal transduction histidine kinase
MKVILDKTILYLCCSVLLFVCHPSVNFLLVVTCLTALCFYLITTYLNYEFLLFANFGEQPFFHILLFFYIGLSFWQPEFCYFLPLLFYDVLYTRNFLLYLCSIFACLYQFTYARPFVLLLLGILFALSTVLHIRSARIQELEKQLREIRDSSIENSLMLKRRNKTLLENQDYEIRVATLKERNRIAREIHDNVGHMLSRSILQVGALAALNKEDTLKAPLSSLNETLQGAMSSIRTSVHDLHDDSIDLQSAIDSILKEYNAYQIQFDYDMGRVVPRSIKYCYISIVKEALSNIVKHSNATKIQIVAREHPSLYQLLIHDNGTSIRISSSGIGLENMQERVNAFHGTFSYQTEQGFRIFISISKDGISDE